MFEHGYYSETDHVSSVRGVRRACKLGVSPKLQKRIDKGFSTTIKLSKRP